MKAENENHVSRLLPTVTIQSGATRENRNVLAAVAAEPPDDPVIVACPICGEEQTDDDGFGVVHCFECGYCQHPSITGDTCDLCDQKIPPVTPKEPT